MNQTNELVEWSDQLPSTVGNDPNGVDLLQVALRRKALLALGIFVGICLSLLYFARAEPVYQSRAMLLIAEKAAPMRAESYDQGYMYSRKADDHAIALASQFNLERVLKNVEVSELPTIKGNEDALKDLSEGITAIPLEDGSEILTVSFQGPSPEDCPDILRTVIDSYMNFLNEEHKSQGQDVLAFFRTNHRKTKAELDSLEGEFSRWRQTESRLLGHQGANIHEQRQANIEKLRFDAQVRLGDIAKRIDQLEGALQLEIDDDTVYMMAVQADPGFARTLKTDPLDIEKMREEFQLDSRNQATLVPLMMRDTELALRYGKEHPSRQVIAASLQMARDFYTDRQDGVETGGVVEMTTREHLLAYLNSLKLELDASKKEIAGYEAEFTKEQELAKSIAFDTFKMERFNRQIEIAQKEYETSLKQFGEMDASEQFSGDDRLITKLLQSPAIGEKVAPNLIKTLAAGTMLGLMCGFGLGYLVEMTDKTFRSPQEVGQALQLPLIGHIPEIEEVPEIEGSSLASVLVTAHKPKSPLAENFRAIRTALYFSGGGSEHRLIQTTSPVPGDGKSTLTANLAISIAQSSKRVLLLDADFRRPTQHKLFGLDMQVGLASVVDGQVEPHQAIQQTEVPNLSVMACGPRPHNPSELLTSPEFEDLLQMLRDQYDFVLVDTPPLLAVTDPGVVSARVDGVLLALRIRKNGRPGTMRARKILADLNANVVGVVVNGVDGRDGAYSYYSNFRSGYNYGYNYVYGQESSTGRAIGKYYDDDRAMPKAESGVGE